MSKGKKIVVLGSTGMAGHVLAAYLEEQGYEVYRISRSERNSERCIQVNISDFNSLAGELNRINPNVIINCIGVLNKACEETPEVAVQLNSMLPHWLSAFGKRTGAKTIHLSTDCVFSGKVGNYKENDFKDGDTFYDRSKALGELNNDRDLTFRMSIIGPDVSLDGIGLFNWFMKQSGVIYGYKNAVWNGVTTICLAQAIDQAIEVNLSGLYHLVPNGEITKYDLLCLFKQVFDKKDVEILENYDFALNKTLINTRQDFDFVVPSYREMITQMRAWIQEHEEMYQTTYCQ